MVYELRECMDVVEIYLSHFVSLKAKSSVLGAELERTIFLYRFPIRDLNHALDCVLDIIDGTGQRSSSTTLSMSNAIERLDPIFLQTIARELLRMPIPSIPNPILLLKRQLLRLLPRKLNIRTLDPRLLHHTRRALIPNTPKQRHPNRHKLKPIIELSQLESIPLNRLLHLLDI